MSNFSDRKYNTLRKTASRQKRRKLYRSILYFFYRKDKISYKPFYQRKNIFRLRQLMKKIILPAIGHLKLKQFRKIVKKVRHVKTKLSTTTLDHLLNKFETRLDVYIYRLNYAPTIQ